MNKTRARRDVLRSRFASSMVMVVAALALSGCDRVPLVRYAGDSYSVAQPPPPVSQNPQPVPPPPAPVVNTAPNANAGGDAIVELPTDHLTLSGSVTDDGLPAGNTLQVQWRVVDGPRTTSGKEGVVFANPGTTATRARFVGGPGEYTLVLSASDGALVGESAVRVTVKPNTLRYPGPATEPNLGWETADPASEGLDVARLDAARDYSRSRHPEFDEAGAVIRGGRLVYQWGDLSRRFEMKSVTKSMGGLTVLLALDEQQMALTDLASDRVPLFGEEPYVDTTRFAGAPLASVTLAELAFHTSGLSKSDLLGTRELLHTPASTWDYSDQALNSLADATTQLFAQDLRDLGFARIYNTLGIRATDLTWRQNVYRTRQIVVNGQPVERREFASGINANVNAMARTGLLMLRKGVWRNDLLLSNEIVESVRVPRPEIVNAVIADPVEFPDATRCYGLMWWTNANGVMPNVPRDAYWAWGLYDQLIIVIPSLDIVAVRAGMKGWRRNPDDWNGNYREVEPFFEHIAAAVTGS